jgi:SnoaL-like domain
MALRSKVGAGVDGSDTSGVPTDRLERLRSVSPPDGTDLVALFTGSGAGTTPASGVIADDATVRFVAPEGQSMGGTGPAGFRENWTDWLSPWETYRIYYDNVFERGDEVVMRVRLRGVTKRGGVEMEHEGTGIFRFEGDQVAEIEFVLGR